ncbi:MAG: diguanylate cyclase [Coriobacteriia bacterium]|nr:diguanylate cyclase [Coriobacteriia bacterium]
METTSQAVQADNRFQDLVYNYELLSKVAFSLICLLCLLFFFFALRNKRKLRWQSLPFMFLCVSVLIWSLCSALTVFLEDPQITNYFATLRYVGIIPIPALLCLHIKQQVSYKELRPLPVVIFFLVPLLLLFLLLRELFFPLTLGPLPLISETQWYSLIFYVYAAVVLIRSYLLCFDVFYQMPKRMRRSTRFMLLGISAVVLLLLFDAILGNQAALALPQNDSLDIILPLVSPFALFLLLYPLYSAMHIMPASDVIVTSREFVMGGMSTAILVLNHNQKILDWNKTDWGVVYPLPQPLFREPFEDYIERLLLMKICRISPHNENIIIAKKDDKETHFLLYTHEARNNKRSFGSIVEISDITPVYTMLRYFEQIARYDQLTGMHNRNSYLHRVSLIAREENMPLLILVGDVNNLKQTNDIHGHLLGDQLLVTVTDVIKKSLPRNAFAARVGGDEFVLLVPRGNAEVAIEFVRKTNELFSQIHHEVFGTPSISWGFAVMTSTQESYNEVFSHADAMMYEYKKSLHHFRSSGLLPSEELDPLDSFDDD